MIPADKHEPGVGELPEESAGAAAPALGLRRLLLACVLALALVGVSVGAVIVAARTSSPTTSPWLFANQPASTGNVVSLRRDLLVGQSARSLLGPVASVWVQTRGVNADPDCLAYVRLTAKGGKVVASSEGVPCGNLVEGWHEFRLGPVDMAPGEQFEFSFAVESPEPFAIDIVAAPWDQYPAGRLVVNGQGQPTDLRFRVTYAPPAADLWPLLLTSGRGRIGGSSTLIALTAVATVGFSVLGLAWLVLAAVRSRTPARARSWPPLLLLLSLVVAHTLAWEFVTPPFLVPDEVQHLHDVRHAYMLSIGRPDAAEDLGLAAAVHTTMLEQRWHVFTGMRPSPVAPVYWWGEPTIASGGLARIIHPATYYELAAWASRALGGLDITIMDQLYIGRLVSVLCGAISVAIVYLALVRAAPGRPDLWFAGALAGGLIPQRLFVLAGVSNDSLAILAGACACAAILLAMTGVSVWACAAAAATALLAVAGKGTALTILPMAGMAFVIVAARLAWRRPRRYPSTAGRPHWLPATLLLGGSALAAGALVIGWRSGLAAKGPLAGFLGTVDAALSRVRDQFVLRALDVLPGVLAAGLGLATLTEYVRFAAESYWGYFGWLQIKAPVWVLVSASVLTVVGLAAAVVGIIGGQRPRPSWTLRLLPVLSVLALLMAFGGILARELVDGGVHQGRYALPATAFHGLLVVIAPAIALPAVVGRYWPVLVGTAMVLGNLASLWLCATVWYSR